MHASLREDYLEAILLIARRHPALPTIKEVAAAMHLPEPEVVSQLSELATTGNVILSGDGTVRLSETGKETGQRVIKKHETLQCFLTEILGMDSSQASSEACKIEHAVSDETIDRLGNYLHIPAGTNSGDTSVYNPSCIETGIQEFSRTLAGMPAA